MEPIKTAKTHTLPTIYAAGAVLYRHTSQGEVEIALIHRGRYNDWSLPKGKLDKKETILEAAWRELREETGYQLAIRGYLHKVSYLLPPKNSPTTRNNKSAASKRKIVYYWAAEAIGGDFIPNEEVDTLLWTSLSRAQQLLSYPLDLTVLQEFAKFPTHASSLVIVRHAKAGESTPNNALDQLRSLDKIGVEQANALTRWLNILNIEELYSADKVRCINTLTPYAAQKQLPISISEIFSDECYLRNPHKTLQEIITLSHKLQEQGLTAAICSQGTYIPRILHAWGMHSDFPITDLPAKKGSIHILSTHNGKILRSHYLADPLDYPLGT